MKISYGWASEYARRKFGTEIDEDDLVRIIRETGLEPDEIMPKLTVSQKFSLMSLEAEYRALQAYMSYLHSPGVEQQPPQDAGAAQARFEQLGGNREEMLQQVKQFFAPESAPAGASA
jgi:hypothetical protein